MIEIEVRTEGSIFDANVEALVNPVNCVGIMGNGLSKEFKKRYRKNFEEYKAACNLKEVKPGRMFVSETGSLGNPRYIINFPTKRNWRDKKSRMEYIKKGLDALADEITDRDIRSIAIPALGCGLGRLEWSDVHERIEDKLKGLADDNRTIILFAPQDAPETAGASGHSTSPPYPKNETIPMLPPDQSQ